MHWSPASSAATNRRVGMPASLFAAWAGQHGSAECPPSGNTRVNLETKGDKSSILASKAEAPQVTGRPVPTVLAHPVTVVTEVGETGLPPKWAVYQAGSRRNPSNPEIAPTPAALDASDPVAWRRLFGF